MARITLAPFDRLPFTQRLRWLALLALLVLMPALASSAWAQPQSKAPLLDGLAGHSTPIESRQPLVQRYFDQGLLLAYSFNPQEAARSFEAAARLNPRCASCWWALAWALGPTINADMAPQDAPRVQQALREARRHAAQASPLRRALIKALSLRHPAADRLDESAYAERLRALVRQYPRSADTALLAAEALMNLQPYDWWNPDGSPIGATREIEALLQRAMRLAPRHPGAHHYWIHLQESSTQPARAVTSADTLRGAYPGSGHLLHMPSHIDLRTGRYQDAIRANQQSIAADLRYLQQVDAQDAYRVGYVAHNHHFLWAAAAMAGQARLALEAAEAARPAACGPSGRDPGSAIATHFAVLPLFTRLRFGQWAALLRDTPPPDAPGAYPLAIWHYARGTAYLRSGQTDAARAELAKLTQLAQDPSLASFKLKNINPAEPLLRIAQLTLRADLALAGGAPSEAVELLRQATAAEDGLAYDEPHLWLAPTRHALGAALLAAGQAAEAEAVYRQDLRHYPGNGWSLQGLALALARQNQGKAASLARQQAKAAFAQAERRPSGSRF